MKFEMKQVARLLVAGAVIAAVPSIVDEDAQADTPVPVFDGHVHYNEDAAVACSPAQIVEKMQRPGCPGRSCPARRMTIR